MLGPLKMRKDGYDSSEAPSNKMDRSVCVAKASKTITRIESNLLNEIWLGRGEGGRKLRGEDSNWGGFSVEALCLEDKH